MVLGVQLCHYFKSLFFQKIWGGNKLTQFNYDIPSESTGECWDFCTPKWKSMILNRPYTGQT